MPEIYFGTLQHLVTHFFNLERCSVARELRFELLLTDVLGIEDKVQTGFSAGHGIMCEAPSPGVSIPVYADDHPA